MLGLASLCCAAAVLPSHRTVAVAASRGRTRRPPLRCRLGCRRPRGKDPQSKCLRKEAAEKAREYKFSKPLYDPEDPNQGTPEFLANARRRSDYESGTTLRDGKGATRDPITGEDLSKRRTYVQAIKDGDDLCATPGACGRTGRWQNKQ